MKADKETVRDIVKMADVMGLYGLQPRKNKQYICPFHSEKTPSLSVKGKIFNCFGCGVKGDIFKFVQLMNDCTFAEALDWLCSAFNIPNDGKPNPEQERRLQARREAAEARERAREYQDYVWRRVSAYRWWLLEQQQTEIVVNHVEWCDRTLDRMLEREVVFDGWDLLRSVDDRLRGMVQQHFARH